MADLNDLLDAVKRGALEDVKAILHAHDGLVRERDEEGATALHHAALGGNHPVVELLVELGANINARDGSFGATPAGWAIEYMRELGGFLGIELSDLEYAIQRREIDWVRRFLTRFPALRNAHAANGTPFRQLALESGNAEIVSLFDSDS